MCIGLPNPLRMTVEEVSGSELVKSEYDFSKAESGKFYHPDAEFSFPVDPETDSGPASPEVQQRSIRDVQVTGDKLIVILADATRIVVPLAWYPRLMHGSSSERQNWREVGGGEGIHWPDLDEDLGVEGLLLGKPSMESQSSFQRWLDRRRTS